MDVVSDKPLTEEDKERGSCSQGWLLIHLCLKKIITPVLREVIEKHFSYIISSPVHADSNAPNENVERKYSELSNVPDRDEKSVLLSSISEVKSLFSETLHSLDSFQNYLQHPGYKTAKQLELSIVRQTNTGKETLTPDQIDKFLDIFGTFTIIKESSYGSDIEPEKYHYSNHKTGNSANENLDNDLQLYSQPRSISEKATQLDLEDQNPSSLPLTSEKNENNFENKYTNENEKFIEERKVFDKKVEPKAKIKLKQEHRIMAIRGEESPLKRGICGSDHDFSTVVQHDQVKTNKNPKVCKGSCVIDVCHVKNEEKEESSYIEHSLRAKMFDKKIIKGNVWGSRMEQMEYRGVERLENENRYLKKQLDILKIDREEILAELGEFTVQVKAKENEQRKSELFQRRVPSSSVKLEHERLDNQNEHPDRYKNSSCGSDITFNGLRSGFPNPHTTPEDKDRLPTNTCELQAGDQQSIGIANNRDSKGIQTPTVENSANVKPIGESRGGEGSNHAVDRMSSNAYAGNVMTPTARNGTNDGGSSGQSYEDLPYSVQQDYSNAPEHISLGNVPPISVTTILYNNYVFLLLSLGQNLLCSDGEKLKDWANQNFSINNPQNDADVLFQLDRKGAINSSELSQLRHFFESINRIDLVCVIDAFLLGDYSLLRQLSAPKRPDTSTSQTVHNSATSSRYQSLFNNGRSSVTSPVSGTTRTSVNRSRATSSTAANNNESQSSFSQNPNLFNNSKQMLLARSPHENHTSPRDQQNAVVMDGSVTNERATGSSTTRIDPPVQNRARNTQTVGTNGSKLSKFQRPDTRQSSSLFQDENWLCSHYKRHCYVKFECCDQFWPCHRCHNNQSSCGRRKLKSRDTQMVKCENCNKVQQFGQFCCDCGAQFASYYCGLCKHLTGREDHPYHCEKCGICRIHGDRSFHCDICGVCLDVQLRGNHRCREGSAHDECCICLEDAFTGCQILPCSHKVHKECATQMIRSGITRCPICRESFAHKLERRPPNSGKRPGNGK